VTGGYRPDIDGLRAVAVLAVVVFHAAPSIAPGGFVGVDVFFVISGYLITGIVLDGVARGEFRFSTFYARRIRRIVPALLAVLLATLAAGWLLLLPAEYRELGAHTAGSAAFAANIVLWDESGYFFAAHRKLLLHLWSLGVEEQFYILWPVAVWAAARRRWVMLALALAAVASFALNVRLTYSPSRPHAFFLLDTRAWELMLGGALAVFARRAPAPLPWPNVSAFAGATLIVASVVHLSGERAFPGWLALPPTIGAALVIGAGPSAWLNRVVLAWRPAIALGLISYALYLWHWPVLALIRLVQPGAGATAIAGGVLASVALAWGTTRWIERPIRSGHHGRAVVPALGAGLALAAVAGLAIATGQISPRSAGYGLERFLDAAVEFPGRPTPGSRPFPYEGFAFDAFESRAKSTALYVGDSKMAHYGPRIAELIRKAPAGTRSAVLATCPGAPPVPGVRDVVPDRCAALLAAVRRYARLPHVEVVVIGAAWHNTFRGSNYFDDGGGRRVLLRDSTGTRQAFAALEAMLRELRELGKTTYLILDSPSGPSFHPGNLVRRSLSGFTIERGGRPLAGLQSEFGWIGEALRAIAARTDTAVIDPMASLCHDDRCPALADDGLPIYVDTGHLRPSFVRAHATFVDRTLLLPCPARSVVPAGNVC